MLWFRFAYDDDEEDEGVGVVDDDGKGGADVWTLLVPPFVMLSDVVQAAPTFWIDVFDVLAVVVWPVLVDSVSSVLLPGGNNVE